MYFDWKGKSAEIDSLFFLNVIILILIQNYVLMFSINVPILRFLSCG